MKYWIMTGNTSQALKVSLNILLSCFQLFCPEAELHMDANPTVMLKGVKKVLKNQHRPLHTFHC